MRVLGIDTSAQSGAVGMIEGEQVVFSERVLIRPGGSEQIPAIIAAALARSGRDVKELELIAVGIGPGSYTGVRVGLAIGKGRPLAWRPSGWGPHLRALAMNGRPRPGSSVHWRGPGGEVYAGLYRPDREGPAEVAPPAI